MVNAMEWIYSQEEYNTKEKRERENFLNIDNEKLEGHLDLRDFVELTELSCSSNQLTSLDLSKCPNLTYLRCFANDLTSVDFLNYLTSSWKINLISNLQ